jgi:putative transcriptional regulator
VKSKKRSRAGKAVVEGLKEAIAHARGEITLPTRGYEVPGPVDVKAIRSRAGLSQNEFARRYGFGVRTLQEWEAGGAKPPSAVRAYLTVSDRILKAVADASRGKTAA